MIDAKTKNIRDFERDLAEFTKNGIGYAARNTINDMVFYVMGESRDEAGRKMVMRNKWTERSIQGRKARGTDLRRLEGSVGSFEEYMREQEEGGVKRATGTHGVAIPTSYAAGQEGAVPRTRVVRAANRLTRIKLSAAFRRRGRSSGARLMSTVHEAIATGRRYAYIEFRGGKGKGIYKIVGGRRTGKSGWPSGAKLKMVHSLKDRLVRIPKNSWLEPSVDKGIRRADDFYERRLVQQIDLNFKKSY